MCLPVLALLLLHPMDGVADVLAVAVLLLRTAYAFLSGIVAVPYNDIVSRSVASAPLSDLYGAPVTNGMSELQKCPK